MQDKTRIMIVVANNDKESSEWQGRVKAVL